MDELIKLIKSLTARKFWGIIEIKMEKGEVVNIKLIENIKPRAGADVKPLHNN